MDTLKPFIYTPVDFGDVLWNYIFQHFATAEFIAVELFVILVMEVMKRNFFETFQMNKNYYPFIALGLDALATLLTFDLTGFGTRIFWLNFILFVALVDVVYTFGGSLIIEFIVNLFSKFKKVQ